MLFLSALLTSSTESNTINVVNNLVDSLQLKVSRTSVKENLLAHPDYPSMLSISDVLKIWKIENLSLRATSDQLDEFPVPFIAQIKENRNFFFTVIKKITDNGFIVSDTALNTWKLTSKEDFINKWTGVVMLLDADEAADVSYERNRKKEKLTKFPAIASTIVFLGIIFYISISGFQSRGWQFLPGLLLLSCKLFGTYLGFLLLWYDLDKNNTILQKVCKAGKNINCNTILQSKAAKLPGGVTWSEIGFAYFAGGLLVLIAMGMNPVMITLLAWLNLFAIPYTFFSIYYQWKVAHQWCVLCVAVQITLVTETVIAISAGLYSSFLLSLIPVYQYLLFVVFLVVPAIFWSLLKPILQGTMDGNRAKVELNRLKHNPQIFQSLLEKQKKIPYEPSGLGLTIGNPHARNKIIKICNPYCGPCAKSHPIIEQLLKDVPDLQVQIIFSASNDERDIKAQPVRHFLAINENFDHNTLIDALDDWYNSPVKDYEAFAKKYTMNGELKKQNPKIDAMLNWCNDTGISFTPMFFVNGYQLPQIYSISDLKYFFQT